MSNAEVFAEQLAPVARVMRLIAGKYVCCGLRSLADAVQRHTSSGQPYFIRSRKDSPAKHRGIAR